MKGRDANITEALSALGPRTLIVQPGNTCPPVNNPPRHPEAGKGCPTMRRPVAAGVRDHGRHGPCWSLQVLSVPSALFQWNCYNLLRAVSAASGGVTRQQCCRGNDRMDGPAAPSRLSSPLAHHLPALRLPPTSLLHAPGIRLQSFPLVGAAIPSSSSSWLPGAR